MAGMDGEDEAPPVALVAGATRGAGRAIAVELARAGLDVYATGRSSRKAGRSEIGRSETIEETGELMAAAGGQGTALVVDHEDPTAVAAWSPGSRRSTAAWMSWSTTSSAATATRSGIRRCGSTTSRAGCGCCAWAWTPT